MVDANGHLKGIVSLNDIALQATRASGGVSPDEICDALEGICEHRDLPAAAGVA